MLAPPLYADGVQAIVSLVLPTPPSANSLFVNAKNGRGRFKSKSYKNWLEHADLALLQHKAEVPVTQIKGWFAMRMLVEFPNNRRRDADNTIKACLDFCVQRGLIEDDCWLRRLELERAPLPGKTVRISIISTK